MIDMRSAERCIKDLLCEVAGNGAWLAYEVSDLDPTEIDRIQRNLNSVIHLSKTLAGLIQFEHGAYTTPDNDYVSYAVEQLQTNKQQRTSS